MADFALSFAAGEVPRAKALTVRVRAAALERRYGRDDGFPMAVLAEGSQWEIKIMGGRLAGTYLLDVPPECQDLSPTERMAVVDKIMRRIGEADAGTVDSTFLGRARSKITTSSQRRLA